LRPFRTASSARRASWSGFSWISIALQI